MEKAIKNCPYCAEEILDAAVKCKHCGEYLDGTKTQTTDHQKHGMPALLSLFVPGLGQVVKGQTGRGIGIFMGTLFGYCLLVIPGIIMHVWNVADAYGQNQSPQEKSIWNQNIEIKSQAFKIIICTIIFILLAAIIYGVYLVAR